MSPPDPCRSCGTGLQHCLEMRDDTATYCCAPCAEGTSQHAAPLSSRDCPLHGKSCNPADPVHDEGHRNLRRTTKDFYYAVLWSPGADPRLTTGVEAFLDSIPPRKL